MPRIVLHIGPEKCGSTTIQRANALPNSALTGLLLDPYLVIGLDTDTPDPNYEAAIVEQMANALTDAPDKVLVVSHEMIFKSPAMARSMARLARQVCDDVRAVAFVRRQSDFAVSAFGQWHFRMPERLSEARDALKQHGIDGALFWGVERHLIAALLEGWQVLRQPSGHLYLDWHRSVCAAQDALAQYGVPLSLGVLPRAGFEGDLHADFLQRAGIEGYDASVPVAQNTGFHPALIEACVNALEAGLEMPGPHEGNDFFASSDGSAFGPSAPPPFLTELKAHVDARFSPRNAEFATDHNLPPAYFAPDIQINPTDLLYAITQEAALRADTFGADHADHMAAQARLAHRAWKDHQSKQDRA